MMKYFHTLLFVLSIQLLIGQSILGEYYFNSTLSGWQNVNGSGQGSNNSWFVSSGKVLIETYDGNTADNWLVSPAYNLDDYDKEWIQFEYNNASSGSIDLFEVYYSTDFNGSYTTANVNAATWISIKPYLWDVANNTYLEGLQSIKAIDLSDIQGDEVYFAFVYNSNGNVNGLHQFYIDQVKITADYYGSLNLSEYGQTFKTSLSNLIDDHNSIPYSNLWQAFYVSDMRFSNDNPYVWDMYTDIPQEQNPVNFIHGEDQDEGFGGQNEGDAYNREHVFPKSWFGGSTSSDMGNDLHHIPPADKRVNLYKNNFPLGNSNGDYYTSSSNGTKIGTCTSPEYDDNVFEPIDAYKGDFARMYFYFATRYESNFDFNGEMPSPVYSNDWKVYPDWLLETLMDWHEDDPVSQKEIDRNNAVYALQDNRNPFIDHPEWVDKVWGENQVNVEMLETNRFSFFPNPVVNNITITGIVENDAVSVTNIVGETFVLPMIRSNDSIDMLMENLEKGVYYIQIKNNRDNIKFIKSIIKE